jgi:general secretion pathway protein B
MSLILDALKKSEAERQRQSGPTLLEVRISKPRRRYPTWVIAVGALLAVNIVLLLAFVLHRPATPPAGSPQTPAAGAATSGAAASGNAAPGAALAAATASNPAALTAPPAAPMAADAALAPGMLVPVAPGLGAPSSSAAVDVDTTEPEPGATSQTGATGDTPERAHNPADDEPALPPGTQDRNIPNFSEVSGDLPDLRLDLHVYAEHVRDRYALINMHRVHEGDTLPEGPRVLAITRAGVVLQYRGQDFTLRPQ